MLSDSSQWVDVDLSWVLSSKVTEINNGYALNGGNIEADVTLTGNQVTNKYGVIFYIANLVPETIYHTNNCELVCYDESGSMLNASLTYFKLVENDSFWIEIDVPHKTHRIEYKFRGKFDVTAMQLYGVNNIATVNVATYANAGTVQPKQNYGVVVEADGKISVDPKTTQLGSFEGTSTNVEDALNELFRYASSGGECSLLGTSIIKKDIVFLQEATWSEWKTITCLGETFTLSTGEVLTNQLTIDVLEYLTDNMMALAGLTKGGKVIKPFGYVLYYYVPNVSKSLLYMFSIENYTTYTTNTGETKIVCNTIWQWCGNDYDMGAVTTGAGHGSLSGEIRQDGGNWYFRYKNVEDLPGLAFDLIQLENASYDTYRGFIDFGNTFLSGIHVARYDYWQVIPKIFNHDLVALSITSQNYNYPKVALMQMESDCGIGKNLLQVNCNSLIRNHVYKVFKEDSFQTLLGYFLALGSNWGVYEEVET